MSVQRLAANSQTSRPVVTKGVPTGLPDHLTDPNQNPDVNRERRELIEELFGPNGPSVPAPTTPNTPRVEPVTIQDIFEPGAPSTPNPILDPNSNPDVNQPMRDIRRRLFGPDAG